MYVFCNNDMFTVTLWNGLHIDPDSPDITEGMKTCSTKEVLPGVPKPRFLVCHI